MKKWRKARWLVVVGLTLLTAIVFIASRYVSVLQVCGDQITFEGTRVKHVCEPYAVEDLAPVLVLIGLLLLPDLSELALPGGLSLKFRLDEQERETQQLKESVDVIRQQLHLTATQSQNISFIERLEQRAEKFEREQRPLDQVPPPDASEPEAPDDLGATAQVASASQQLNDMWLRLEPWKIVGGNSDESAVLREWLQTPPPDRDQLTLSPRAKSIADRLASDETLRRLSSDKTLGRDQVARIKEWATDFRDVLNFVQLARNDVAYPPHGWDADKILDAFAVGERLLGLLVPAPETATTDEPRAHHSDPTPEDAAPKEPGSST